MAEFGGGKGVGHCVLEDLDVLGAEELLYAVGDVA